MHRRTTLVLLAATIALIGCDQIYDELGLSPEDQEALEDVIEGIADAAGAEGAAGSGGDGSEGDDDPGGDGPPVDPGWSPPGMPPPPADPTASEDSSDTAACPSGWSCGTASYDHSDDQAVRDHYEEIFGRPPDTGYRSSDATTGKVGRHDSSWSDGDVVVEVTFDAINGDGDTHVRVEAENTVVVE